MPATLEHLAHARDNDYAALEVAYRATTGAELVSDPFGALRCAPASPALTASIVIPAWNARGTLVKCLRHVSETANLALRFAARPHPRRCGDSPSPMRGRGGWGVRASRAEV
jgi:hypothetical protein